MSSKSNRFSLMLLTIAIALFFIISGFVAIMNYDSAANQLGRALSSLLGSGNQTLSLVIAIAQFIFGIILFIDVFMTVSQNTMIIVKFVIFAAWVAFILITYFFNRFLEPDFLSWMKPLSLDLVVLAGLWLVKDNKA